MRNRSSNKQWPVREVSEAADRSRRKRPDEAAGFSLPLDGMQVVRRRCTVCEWEAQLVERGPAEDPLCPWCYAPTERTTLVGVVMPPAVPPGEKNPYASSLGRRGGLKGGPARAAKLSAKQRRDIASKAAKARWTSKKTISPKRGRNKNS